MKFLLILPIIENPKIFIKKITVIVTQYHFKKNSDQSQRGVSRSKVYILFDFLSVGSNEHMRQPVRETYKFVCTRSRRSWSNATPRRDVSIHEFSSRDEARVLHGVYTHAGDQVRVYAGSRLQTKSSTRRARWPHLLLAAINEIRSLYRNVSVVTRVRLAYLATETSYAPNCERLHAPTLYGRPSITATPRAIRRTRAASASAHSRSDNRRVFGAELILTETKIF